VFGGVALAGTVIGLFVKIPLPLPFLFGLVVLLCAVFWSGYRVYRRSGRLEPPARPPIVVQSGATANFNFVQDSGEEKPVPVNRTPARKRWRRKATPKPPPPDGDA
jgi:hypothetical protein